MDVCGADWYQDNFILEARGKEILSVAKPHLEEKKCFVPNENGKAWILDEMHSKSALGKKGTLTCWWVSSSTEPWNSVYRFQGHKVSLEGTVCQESSVPNLAQLQERNVSMFTFSPNHTWNEGNGLLFLSGVRPISLTKMNFHCNSEKGKQGNTPHALFNLASGLCFYVTENMPGIRTLLNSISSCFLEIKQELAQWEPDILPIFSCNKKKLFFTCPNIAW